MDKYVDLGYWIRVFRNNLSMNGQVGESRVLGKGFGEQFKHEWPIRLI